MTALRGKDLRQWRARSAMIFSRSTGRPAWRSDRCLMGRLSTVPTWRSLAQLWPEHDKAIAMSALEQFDMALIAAQRADQLSGGQQQRVAIARRWCRSLILFWPTSRSPRSIPATPGS